MTRITKAFYEQLQEHLAFKKKAIKHCDPVTIDLLTVKEFDLEGVDITKAAKYLYENDELKGLLRRSIVANTYNWMDSHGDVHLDNVFGKSIAERGKDSPHLHDHIFELGARVGKPIKFEERLMSWRELGASKTGKTMALIMETEIKKSYNERVYEDYLNNEINQHSVAMRYIKIDLAANDEENYPKEFALYQKVLPLLGNRKTAEEQGYFFVVAEAALIEVSAVLLGSNELTPTLGPKPPTSTPEEEKSRHPDTQLLAEIERLQKRLILNNIL